MAQEALLASESRFHDLVDAVTDYAIFLLDERGHILNGDVTGFAKVTRDLTARRELG